MGEFGVLVVLVHIFCSKSFCLEDTWKTFQVSRAGLVLCSRR